METRKKYPKSLTAEEVARRERTDELVHERLAYHERKAREEEESRARAAESWVYRVRLRIARSIAP
jgi:hypothetical protein